MKYIVSKGSMVGDRLGTIETDAGIEAAASEAARQFLRPRGYGPATIAQVHASRVTGDPGLSGCFRVATPGPNRNAGETALGQQFHVREA